MDLGAVRGDTGENQLREEAGTPPSANWGGEASACGVGFARVPHYRLIRRVVGGDLRAFTVAWAVSRTYIFRQVQPGDG